MTRSGPPGLQDAYLNTLRREKVPLVAYLVNGVPIKGRILSFDNFVVLFEAEGKQQLVFKHAISTIQPSRPIPFGPKAEPESEPGADRETPSP